MLFNNNNNIKNLIFIILKKSTVRFFRFTHKSEVKQIEKSEKESRLVVSDSLRPIQSMEFSRPEYWSG